MTNTDPILMNQAKLLEDLTLTHVSTVIRVTENLNTLYAIWDLIEIDLK